MKISSNVHIRRLGEPRRAAAAAERASQHAARADADGLGGGAAVGADRLHPLDHVGPLQHLRRTRQRREARSRPGRGRQRLCSGGAAATAGDTRRCADAVVAANTNCAVVGLASLPCKVKRKRTNAMTKAQVAARGDVRAQACAPVQ